MIDIRRAPSGYNTIEEDGTPLPQRKTINFTGAGVTASDVGGETQVNIPGGGGPGGNPAYTAFSKNLGVARSSGTFDITGLSGLTPGKEVNVIQTAAPIATKGDSRDEMEMDHISVTGYVLDANTIRCYWHATGVVVGDYNFAYFVGG